MSQQLQVSSDITVQQLPVDQLRPNAYNPNRMSDEQFDQLVAEVRRLGTIAKPIIVRPLEGGFEIIDGEHNWRAAKVVGLIEVSCQVFQADDFEARLQTLKRNQHGEHAPVREGRVFQEMINLLGVSQREFASTIKISEATVRNRLKYVQAADLRSAYAGADRSEEISKLSLQQVEFYLALPGLLREKWLDAGGHVQLVHRYGKDPLSVRECFACIVRAGLADSVQGTFVGFTDTIDRALDLCEWADDKMPLETLAPYLRVVAELDLTPVALDMLPMRLLSGTVEIVLSADDWNAIVAQSHDRNSDLAECLQLIEIAIRKRLRALNVAPEDLATAHDLEMLDVVAQAPEFIQQAEHLSLDEKFYLAGATASVLDELLLEAKQRTSEALRLRRTASREGAAESDGEPLDIEQILRRHLTALVQQSRLAIDQERVGSRDSLNNAILNVIGQHELIRMAKIGGRPAPDLFAAWLAKIEWPELQFLGACVLGHTTEDALARWLGAMQSACVE